MFPECVPFIRLPLRFADKHDPRQTCKTAQRGPGGGEEGAGRKIHYGKVFHQLW